MFSLPGVIPKKEIVYVDREVRVVDSIEVRVTDTFVDIQKESEIFDHYVRENTWTDSSGIVHNDRYEKEIRSSDKYERLTTKH